MSEITVVGESKIIAIGSETDSILFAGRNMGTAQSEWYGINITESFEDQMFSYIKLQNAEIGIQAVNCHVRLEHSYISHSFVGLV